MIPRQLPTRSTYISVVPTIETRNIFTGLELDPPDYDNPMARRDYHVTLMYSYLAIPQVEMARLIRPRKQFEAEISGFTRLGKFIVAELDSEALTERHEFWLSQGLLHTYPEYIPHLSLFKDTDTDIEAVNEAFEPLIGAKLVFTRETAVNLKD